MAIESMQRNYQDVTMSENNHEEEGRAFKARRTSPSRSFDPPHAHEFGTGAMGPSASYRDGLDPTSKSHAALVGQESEHTNSLEPGRSDSSRKSSNSPNRPKGPHLDIVHFPPTELLRILAALLQHIATSNDQLRPFQRSHTNQSASLSSESSEPLPSMYLSLNDPKRPNITSAALTTLNAPSSTLCFHARHIPSISIEAYLLRILKYCPMTNEIFLSLLVYFDRLSRVGALGHFPGESPPSSYGSDACDSLRPEECGASTSSTSPSPMTTPWATKDTKSSSQEKRTNATVGHFPGISGFAIDSYNVHRLVIAGVTVASKFFSDVFYTNARYAKVGGLAVHELNQLELHFLLLTDFRLMIPVSEIQQYGDQLLAYAHDRSASSTVARPLPQAAEERHRESGNDAAQAHG